ncbi:MAG: YceI family protein [Acidobacteriota bacterium]|nr:YceI family protein [Acidobacteriota bacterium]
MSPDGEHSHDHEHRHEGHDHAHDHGHDHALIVDRLPAGTWRIDPHGSEVLFKARIFGFLPMTGLFEDFAGELSADPTGGVSGQLVVQTASVDSGWARRDRRLRSASYFDVDRHPQMVFTLERIEPSGADQMSLSGSLQIQHASAPLSFPVYVIAHGDHLHLEGRVMVDHDLAGLGWSKPFFVADRLSLEVALTLTRA